MGRMNELISVFEAQQRILKRVRRIDAERVPIERAADRVLAEAAIASVDLPPFASSAMDGYAVRSADTEDAPVTLALTGRIAAGSPATKPVGGGETMAISTGGVVPEGSDAVIPLEFVEEGDGSVRIPKSVVSGDNVRAKGEDIKAGATVLEAGVRLTPARVAALAAAGLSEVQCSKRPRVGILVTGSELRSPGETLGPGEIYESNGLLLAALCQSAGAVPAQLGAVADDAESLGREMERALLGFDMLITSGGASVGPHDLVRSTFGEFRIEEVFWGVAVKPGRPVSFGVRRDHLVFVLPGNPVSVLVTFELLVRPAIEAVLGRPDPLPRFERGSLGSSLHRRPERDEYVRAQITHEGDQTVVTPVSGQESHMIVRAGRADALICIPAGTGEIEAGVPVSYLTLD